MYLPRRHIGQIIKDTSAAKRDAMCITEQPPIYNAKRLQLSHMQIDRNNAIFDHWLAGETSSRIAKKCHLARRLIDRIVENGKVARLSSSAILEQPPHLNIWKEALCDQRFGQG